MAEVRRRRRSSNTSDATNGDGGNEETTVLDATSGTSSNGASRSSAVRPVKETIDNEKSTATLMTIAGIALGIFFIYLGISTDVPIADVSHAVIIDAGSTGTRAQVFSFRDRSLFQTKLFAIDKPISHLAFGSDSTSFFKSMLDGVKSVIPGVKRRKSVPLALRATAGLRLSVPEHADRALDEARKALKSSGFLVKDEWISIMDDQSEGTGAWTTVNYLRGHLNGSLSESVGIMELGGASLQIVFEANDEALEEVDVVKRAFGKSRASHPLVPRIVEGNWGGKDRKLISINRLGFGLNEFTKKLYSVFDREGVLTEGNPCFRKGKVLEDKILLLGSGVQFKETFTGDGDFERCVASAQIALAQYGPLDTSLLATFKGEVVGFAFLYDLTVALGISESPTKEELMELGKKLCEGDGSTANDTDEICLEYSYVYLLLSEITGGFKNEAKLKLVQYIDGHMLGWSLGSVLTDFGTALSEQLV